MLNKKGQLFCSHSPHRVGDMHIAVGNLAAQEQQHNVTLQRRLLQAFHFNKSQLFDYSCSSNSEARRHYILRV